MPNDGRKKLNNFDKLKTHFWFFAYKYMRFAWMHVISQIIA